MSGSTRPTCYIIAAANGAGKTTFALNYLPKIVSCRNFINVDEIARGVSPLNIEAGLLHASRIFLQLMRQKIAQREDFAFETTLSGKSWLRRIRQMQNNGWRVVLYYLYIPSAAVSKSRVKQRVEQGGHDIPIADLERRYPRSVTNLFAYTEICDVVICLDNSTENAKPIFEKKNAGGIEIINQELYQQIQEQATHD